MSNQNDEEKCFQIANELTDLQQQVNDFNGLKNDKTYMKLEELLTRCLLKLDELDRKDENINKQRRTLIDFTNELADYLESKASKDATNNDSNKQKNNKRQRILNTDNVMNNEISYFDPANNHLVISQNDVDSKFKCINCDTEFKLIDYFSHKLYCQFE